MASFIIRRLGLCQVVVLLLLLLLPLQAESAAISKGDNPLDSVSRRATVSLETATYLFCTGDVMHVRVNVTQLRRLYNDTDPAHISLLDESCTGNASGDDWTIDNPHSRCFTQRQIDGDNIYYKNALIYKEPGVGPIVREHRWRLDLQCSFPRQRKVGMLAYDLGSRSMTYDLRLNADLEAKMTLYNDSSLKHPMDLTQKVRVGLGDDLYVKIDLQGDWNVSLHLRQCVAKPLAQGSDISYTLIQDGCPTDSETYIIYTTPNSTLFHFAAFEFYQGATTTVYIDCNVTYCSPLDSNQPSCRPSCR